MRKNICKVRKTCLCIHAGWNVFDPWPEADPESKESMQRNAVAKTRTGVLPSVERIQRSVAVSSPPKVGENLYSKRPNSLEQPTTLWVEGEENVTHKN